MDQRIEKLAGILVNHSVHIKKGYIIEINAGVEAKDLVNELARQILLKGAFPRINLGLEGFAYTYYKYASEEQLKHVPKLRIYEAKNIDGTISIGTEYNTKELSSIDPARMAMRRKALKSISEISLKKNNWVLMEFPTNSLAQDAEMSLQEFEDFVYGACLVDWEKEGKALDCLKYVLDQGSEVRIIGSGTDLRFSIKGRQAIKCYGKRNMPDGEVFIAPVETSTDGHICYDYPVIYSGKEIDKISLEFKAGKVINAKAAKNEELLKKMIELDSGASRLGEFGIGTNYSIKRFIKQILFDEKIGGTVHLALGMAYKKGGGKNESALHWDMIKDLRSEGKVLIDNKVIEENGKLIMGN